MTAAHVPRRGRPSPDLIGNRYTRLVVIGRAVQMDARARWVCRCDCGTIKPVLAQSLLEGSIKSCGCLRAETARATGKRNAGVNIPQESRSQGGKMAVALARKRDRIADAFASVFREPPDTVHVDRKGARVVRGGRY